MRAPCFPDEKFHLLKLSSLNWDARECLAVGPQGVPAHVHVGSYSEGPQVLLGLGPMHLHWSKKHTAYVYNLVPPNKPVTMQYTRRRFVGTRGNIQSSFTAYHASNSSETVGAKLSLTVLGSGDSPLSERLPDLKDSDARILAQKYPARVFERGPKRFDFFDVDFLEDDDAVQPRAVGRESVNCVMNISEPELIGQPPRHAAQTGQEDQGAGENPASGEHEDLGWTGPWVDRLLSVVAKGRPLWTRREVKWHYDAEGNKLWGIVLVFKPISFEKYTQKGTEHPHKSIQAYTVQATVKKAYVTLKWIELMGGSKSEDVYWMIFDAYQTGFRNMEQSSPEGMGESSSSTPPASAAKSRSSASMSSSEDEAPETVSRAASRSQAAAQRKQKRAFADAEREKRQAKSKARAGQQKTREEQDSAVARMERAMREAQEEDSGDSDEEEDEDNGGSMDEDDEEEEDAKPYDGERIRDMDFSDSGEEDDSGEGDDDSEDNEDSAAAGGHDSDSSMEEDPKPSYLPDHLFQKALATVKHPKSPPKELSNAAKKRLKRKERKKARHQDTKDVQLGDRTVRVLPSEAHSARSAARRTLPPASMNKFVRKSLLLRSSDRKRDWERKSADLMMNRARKRPAQNFVRG